MPHAAALPAVLSRRGAATSAELQRALGVGQATLSRSIASLGDQIVRLGAGRNTRYALQRTLPNIGSSWPLVRIDAEGKPILLGHLHALARDQYWFDAELGTAARLSDGLPFYLQDLIPQGFLGRFVPRRFFDLGLPERVADWHDDHVLTYLCQRGEDCMGDLLLGNESLQRFLEKQRSPLDTAVDASSRSRHYDELADLALEGETAGSSAAGEHPKFTTTLRDGNGIRKVLVKFSPGGTDRVARRWADLIICEHLATHALHRAGLSSHPTELLFEGDRVFIEANRFDRTGAHGRLGLISLAALSNEYLGRRDNWITATAALAKANIISTANTETVRRVATFGQLIGNTDMHFGNLSFRLTFDDAMALTPIYDMLPMIHAPVAGGAIPTREMEAPLPSASVLDIWTDSTALAQEYWRTVAKHEAISSEFAAIARRNAERIATVASIAR